MSIVSEPVSAKSFVMLRNGPTVRLEAVRLVLDLEARGVRLQRDGDDVVISAPASQVTNDDRTRLRQFKPHVLALIDYCTREAVQ
jgi:hypothetical protein